MGKHITFRTGSKKAYHLGVDSINPNILTAGSPGRVRKVVDYVEKAEVFEGEHGLTIVNGEHWGLPVSAMSAGMGPASTAIVLPEAIEIAKGNQITVLRIGTCGSLQPFVKIGHLVVSTGAVRDEATTSAVVGPEYPAVASYELIPAIVTSAEKRGYKLHKKLWTGITHTKDDIYFTETPHLSPSREIMTAKLNSYRRMGVLASEMEFSVHCILRDFYKTQGKEISAGALLAVLAQAPEKGSVTVGKINKDLMDRDLIKIGLDALWMAAQNRKEQHV